ncbi:MAG: hypothetical protein K0S55_881 [Clostridia bacterium]|nr:hypothetical protein [Clostridia bacterium]
MKEDNYKYKDKYNDISEKKPLFPLILKRNRTKSIFIYSFMFILTIACFILRINIKDTSMLYIYGIIAFVFCLAVIFNIYLSSEITYEIDEKAIYSRSRFLTDEIIETKNLVSIEYGETGKNLIIYYNRPEYNVAGILEDVEKSDEKNGMWSLTISNKDINMSLAELKYLIQILIENNKRWSEIK